MNSKLILLMFAFVILMVSTVIESVGKFRLQPFGIALFVAANIF